jgi:hypothetical protein
LSSYIFFYLPFPSFLFPFSIFTFLSLPLHFPTLTFHQSLAYLLPYGNVIMKLALVCFLK